MRHRRPHAEGVPRLLDAVVRVVAVDERVHDLRAGRVTGIHGMDPEVRPHRRQRSEDLVTGDLPAALDAPRRGRREQDRDVVAGFAVAGGEHVAVGGLGEHPVAGGVAGAVQIGAQADEVVVHVDGDRGRRGDVGDAPLQPVDLGEVQTGAAEVGRQRGREVSAGTQLLEVLVEEAVGRGRTPAPARRSGRASRRSPGAVTSGAVKVAVIGSLLCKHIRSIDRPVSVLARIKCLSRAVANDCGRLLRSVRPNRER